MQVTYRNPVWPGEFADPFVLKWQGEYYAYGTSSDRRDNKIFPILHSQNLAEWTHLTNALDPLPGLSDGNYWAPEVVERDGKFYMYFSAGKRTADETQRLHVAVADHPAGPFRTVTQLLPDEGFTIDASPFRDPKDNRWYLFFCKDFFHGKVGTGVAVVPLADSMTATVGNSTPILRASADWQIYERNRTIYGRTWDAWYTVEGPNVLYHAGRYYCLYSGGAWHSLNYGVSFGVADQVLGPYQDLHSSQGPSVLQGIQDQVLGPGHNSVVVGPDDHTLFMVYHAWDAQRTARRMCIDPLQWTPNGPKCAGPTTDDQTLAGA